MRVTIISPQAGALGEHAPACGWRLCRHEQGRTDKTDSLSARASGRVGHGPQERKGRKRKQNIRSDCPGVRVDGENLRTHKHASQEPGGHVSLDVSAVSPAWTARRKGQADSGSSKHCLGRPYVIYHRHKCEQFINVTEF